MRADNETSRIAPVDGLRALAVLGVIWAHVWAFSGNPALSIGSVAGIDLDINRAVSVIGTGVDLFFVVSGFCMYLSYGRNKPRISWQGYRSFLKRRWLRIAPAFYVAAAVAAIGFSMARGVFPTYELIANLAFLHIWLPDSVLVAPFWSLATEWHFYVVLPLLIWVMQRFGFWSMVAASVGFCIGIRIWVYSSPPQISGVWDSQLPTRLVEFVWGICVARVYAADRSLPAVLRGSRGFIVGAAVAYAGRLLMVSEVVRFAGSYGLACKVVAEPVLTLGYGLMLWNLISSPSWFRRMFSVAPLRAVGRWSYSLYLWHWWPAWWVSTALATSYGSTALVQHVSLLMSLSILLPLAFISYRVLEMPYFNAKAALSNPAFQVV